MWSGRKTLVTDGVAERAAVVTYGLEGETTASSRTHTKEVADGRRGDDRPALGDPDPAEGVGGGRLRPHRVDDRARRRAALRGGRPAGRRAGARRRLRAR